MARTWTVVDGEWYPTWEPPYTDEDMTEMDHWYWYSGPYYGEPRYITMPPDAADNVVMPAAFRPAWACLPRKMPTR
jgi:hypothetical protein